MGGEWRECRGAREPSGHWNRDAAPVAARAEEGGRRPRLRSSRWQSWSRCTRWCARPTRVRGAARGWAERGCATVLDAEALGRLLRVLEAADDPSGDPRASRPPYESSSCARPRLDQRAVYGEMLGEDQASALRLAHDLLEGLSSHLVLHQPVAVLREYRGVSALTGKRSRSARRKNENAVPHTTPE